MLACVCFYLDLNPITANYLSAARWYTCRNILSYEAFRLDDENSPRHWMNWLYWMYRFFLSKLIYLSNQLFGFKWRVRKKGVWFEDAYCEIIKFVSHLRQSIYRGCFWYLWFYQALLRASLNRSPFYGSTRFTELFRYNDAPWFVRY